MMMSGARSSIRRLSRLFRLITRRYRSFRSEVANRPPSSGTSGRSSGGRTGTTSSTIHSGLLPELRNASTIRRRLVIFFRFCCDVSFTIRARSWLASSGTVSFFKSSRMASAPIPARKLSPYSSSDFRYCSSVRSCL